MVKIFRYLRRYRMLVLFCFFLLFIQAVCDLSLPRFMSDIVNVGIKEGNVSYIITKGVDMLFITLLSAIANITASFFASRISASSAMKLRQSVFEKVESFSNQEFDHFSTASLITRTTNDVTQIQSFIMMGIRLLCYAPIMGIGGIIMALSTSTYLSFIIVISVLILILVVVIMFLVVVPKFETAQKMIDKLNLVVRENLSGIMVIRSFSNQKFEEQRFDKVNIDLTKIDLSINRVMSLMMPTMMFIMNASSLLIVWIASHRVSSGFIQVGDMMAFMQYSMQVIISFLFLSMMFIMIPRATVSAHRIVDVLEWDLSIKDSIKTSEPENTKQIKIVFNNVSFCYNNAEDYTLQNITFTAMPGQTTAFIGPTGSGKSTLMNLLLRFYDVTSGKITFNDVNIKDIAQESLRDLIGYVPQKGILFSGTVASNLRFGNENANNEDLIKSSKIAQALEFIEQKNQGFDLPISQGGGNVSGGQKQRLSIARALVKNPPIYIFDDSFSALDFKTDLNLRKELKQYTINSTVLIVAQRVSTIMNADQIIVLDEGKIVGRGTHKQLLKNCKTYREIAESQLSK